MATFSKGGEEQKKAAQEARENLILLLVGADGKTSSGRRRIFLLKFGFFNSGVGRQIALIGAVLQIYFSNGVVSKLIPHGCRFGM